MITILASIAIVVMLSIPIGILLIYGLAIKVAYDIRKRSLLERYLCVVYDMKKSKRIWLLSGGLAQLVRAADS